MKKNLVVYTRVKQECTTQTEEVEANFLTAICILSYKSATEGRGEDVKVQ